MATIFDFAHHSFSTANAAQGDTLKPPSPLLTAAELHFKKHGGATPSPLSSSSSSSIVSGLTLNDTAPAIVVHGPAPADLPSTRDLRASAVAVSDADSVYSTAEEEFVSAVQSVGAEHAVVVVDARTEAEIVEAVIERLGGPGAVVEVVETQELAAADAMPEPKKTYQLEESKRSKLRRTLRNLKKELHVSSQRKYAEVEKPRPTASDKYHHLEGRWAKVGRKCKRASGKCGKAVRWVVYLPKRTVDGVEGLSDKDRVLLGKVVATIIVFSGALACALCIAVL
jgi:hypothetical protein